MEGEKPPGDARALSEPHKLISYLETQDHENSLRQARKAFDEGLQEATQANPATSDAVSKLSDFIKRCKKSESISLRNWVFSQAVVVKLYESYVESDELDQRRSTKVLLDLVVQLLRDNPRDEAAYSIANAIILDLMSIIRGTSTKPVIKSAVKASEYLLSKGVLTLPQLGSTYKFCHPQGFSMTEQQVWPKFFAELLQWVRVSTVCPLAGKFVVSLYRMLRAKGEETPDFISVEAFKGWLLDLLLQDPTVLEPIKNYVFGPLFKGDRQEAIVFLNSLGVESMSNPQQSNLDLPQLFQIAALDAGKRVGLVEEPDSFKDSSDKKQSSSVVLPEKILTSVLSHPALEVRSLAFSLLISSPSTTRPYSATALDLLRRYIGIYYADTDAKFRVDVMARSREMFKRVRGSICVLKRSIPRAKAKARQKENKDQTKLPEMRRTTILNAPVKDLEDALDEHVEFLRWYILFLRNELIPTASYQRHIGSLKSLATIAKFEEDSSKPWETPEDQEIFFDLFDASWARALYDLIMDPFEDVRELAAANLRSLLSDRRFRAFRLSDVSTVEELRDVERRCDVQARRTARADDADGAARMAQVVYKVHDSTQEKLSFMSSLLDDLESRLDVAERDLGRAVLEAPVHGRFAALRYIWVVVPESKFEKTELEVLQEYQSRIAASCERLWKAVRDILCDDSPEGHLPQELEEVDGLTTRDVLSYSFRSVHESSDLMRTIALTLRQSKRAGSVHPPPGVFRRIGALTFEQLSTLRHRGAFTTVSQTFATCCQQTIQLNSGSTDGSDLLNVWYKGTMDAIFAQASTTRRSAGIPSLMTGILSANAASPSFEEVMQKLIDIAGTEAFVRETDGSGSNLPQVHAFNCLKDIFKNSFLTSIGNKSEGYITQCLQLAATCLKSDVWAIRNCSLILLRSLIDSLFGSSETKHMIEAGWDGKANRISYQKYATLPDLLVNLLESGHQMMAPTATSTAGAESVFPALDIIRRAGPPDTHRKELQTHVEKYLASPVWHVREMAARTMCSCLLHDLWFNEIEELLASALEDSTRNAQNRVHGTLLALKFVLERLQEVSPVRVHTHLGKIQDLLNSRDLIEEYRHCPDIGAAYLAIPNLLWAFGLDQDTLVELKVMDDPPPRVVSSGALVQIQTCRLEIYGACRSESSLGLRHSLLDRNASADAVVAGLELIPKLWKPSTTSTNLLLALAELYVRLCLERSHGGIHVVALQNLADILDILCAQAAGHLPLLPDLLQLWTALPWNPTSPSLSDAIIRISGCIMAIMVLQGSSTASGLHSWGKMVADAGLDDKPFDTRYAAIETLNSFFATIGQRCNSEEYIPALVSLYDSLNDDDDEIRDAAAEATKHILGQATVPLEAANRLLSLLSETFSDSAEFKAIVVTRLTGARPAAEQIDAALKVDDALFAVEEQNLFIDEIRETKRWIQALEAVLDADSSDPSVICKELEGWLVGGVDRLHYLFQENDGPLGWSSRPQAFAVASAVILCSISLVSRRQGSSTLQDGLRALKAALEENKDKHISGFLAQPLRGLEVVDLTE